MSAEKLPHSLSAFIQLIHKTLNAIKTLFQNFWRLKFQHEQT